MTTISSSRPASPAAASPIHSKNENQSEECSPSMVTVMAMASQSQPVTQTGIEMQQQQQHQLQVATQLPLTQLDSSSAVDIKAAVAVASQGTHSDSQNHNSAFPESQIALLLQTQPDDNDSTQIKYQLSLAEATQGELIGSQYCSVEQRIMEEDETAQEFITQPMTQQCSIPERPLTLSYSEGRSSELHLGNEYNTDYCANDDAMSKEFVKDDVADDAVGSTQSRQPDAVQQDDRIHTESTDHRQAIPGPEVLPPAPSPLPPSLSISPLQSLTRTRHSDITKQLCQTSQPAQRINAVVNPYAKKRPLDQSRRCSSSSCSSVCGATNSASSSQNLQNNDFIRRKNVTDDAAGSTVLVRKAVYNPYAKTSTNALQRQSMASSVGEMKVAASPLHTINNYLPGNTVKTAPVTLPVPPSRRKGISISLPVYERLPSRNVSYQPAEILTVGELYRYLYHPRRGDEVDHSENTIHQALRRSEGVAEASGDVEIDCTVSNEITSIRITGTLLCVATSNSVERDAGRDSLYGCGTFLLIGDPLETSRLSKRDVIRSVHSDAKNAKSNIVGSETVTPKVGSDNVSNVESSTITANTSMVELNIVADQIRGASSAKHSAAQRTNETDTSITTMKSKELNRGILNTQKKKLVYNGGGKRLSFGGRGLGGNSRGVGGGGGCGLLVGGRKFVTPKRIDCTSNVTLGLASAMKRGSSASVRTGDGSATNTKPENVIQHHPSPMVPVWLGSFYNGDGLDGSVVGDLVMIMGELVREYCVNCQVINATNHGSESKNDHGNEETSTKVTVNQSRHLHSMRNVPTLIRGVKDASTSIARIAVKISGGHQSSSTATMTSKRVLFCSDCPRFVRARFVKNANETDVLLQREALRARRAYMQERRRQMESLNPSCILSKGLYSVGCGPL